MCVHVDESVCVCVNVCVDDVSVFHLCFHVLNTAPHHHTAPHRPPSLHRQTYLLKHKFDVDFLKKKEFKIFCKYIAELRGKARERELAECEAKRASIDAIVVHERNKSDKIVAQRALAIIAALK
jgi:hypothetical protein